MRRPWTLLALVPLALAACRVQNQDRELERRVTTELDEDDRAVVAVSAESRVVRLAGVVPSEADRARIENEARGVSGVLGVDNQLIVQPPVTTTGATTPQNEADRAVAEEVERRLSGAGFPGLRAEVGGGVVRITGAVPINKHDDALRIAREAAPPQHLVDDETVVH